MDSGILCADYVDESWEHNIEQNRQRSYLSISVRVGNALRAGELVQSEQDLPQALAARRVRVRGEQGMRV